MSTIIDTAMTSPDDHEADDTEADVLDESNDPTEGLTRSGLLALAVVVFVGRLSFSAERTIFHLIPDEPATIGMARWLSGTGSWNMFAADVWRPGTALLIAPLYWITDDQTTIIRLSLGILAAVAAWSSVWLARIVLRLTELGPRAVLVVSGVVALTPASLSASAYVWAEPLVTLTFLAALWHLMLHVERPSMRHALAAVSWASLGLVVHNRLMPMVAIVFVIVIARSVRTRRWMDVAASGGAAIVIVGFAQWSAAVVRDRVWEDPGVVNTVGGTLGRLADPLDVLDAAAGQLWYLLASTLMLFGIGGIVLVRSAVDHSGSRRSADARIVLVTIGALIATSMVFMSGRWRTDQLIYGRYNDAVIWPLLAVGAVWLFDGIRRDSAVARRWVLLAPVATCAVLTLLLIGLHGDDLERLPAFSTMIAGLQPMMDRTYIVDPARIAVIAFTVFGLLLLGTRARRPLSVALVVSLLFAGGVATRHTVAPRINFVQRNEVVQELAGTIIPAGATVGVRFTPDSERPPIPLAYQATYWYLYQWFLDDMTFVTDTGLEDGIGPYVFSTVDDPVLVEAGATRLWTDRYVPLALWLEPGPED